MFIKQEFQESENLFNCLLQRVFKDKLVNLKGNNESI